MAALTEIDCWGLPLEQYIHSQRQVGSLTSLEQLQASIAALEDPASVTCSTLEHILSVTSYPHKLLALGAIQLTHISFGLLQNYTENNRIFDYQYGLLCLQVLILSLQINVLTADNQLEDFVREILETSTCTDISSILSERAAKMSWLITADKDAGLTDDAYCRSFFLANHRCQGGLSDEDIGRIQSWLWHDRRSYFDICGVVSGTHWAMLFFMFWFKIAQLTITSASITGGRSWYQLSNLICRYAIATPETKEMYLISPLGRSIHDQLDSQGFTDDEQMRPPPEDFSDAAMFREAAIHRLISPYGPPLDLHMTLAIFRFIEQHGMYALDIPNIEPLLSYIEAACTRLWAEIELEKSLANAGQRANVITLMRSVFELASMTCGGVVIAHYELDVPMSRDMRDVARKIGKTLHRVDWVNLTGRVLLLPLIPYENKHPSLEAFNKVQEHWSETRERIELLSGILFKYDQDVLEDFNSDVVLPQILARLPLGMHLLVVTRW
ncbi:hypothetical protein BDV93DRAFT_562172 [Ceratobasidium sp. AG-I]|nr:hypothetical protein BDV93DRAFT_562172 [Ceratobasidium sp. AG-I]